MPAVAETIGKKYGVPYFTDENEMLKNVDCDAVYIGTPVCCHFEQAMTALKVKKLFNQYVFASNEALNLLKFVEAREI